MGRSEWRYIAWDSTSGGSRLENVFFFGKHKKKRISSFSLKAFEFKDVHNPCPGLTVLPIGPGQDKVVLRLAAGNAYNTVTHVTLPTIHTRCRAQCSGSRQESLPSPVRAHDLRVSRTLVLHRTGETLLLKKSKGGTIPDDTRTLSAAGHRSYKISVYGKPIVCVSLAHPTTATRAGGLALPFTPRRLLKTVTPAHMIGAAVTGSMPFGT